MSDKEASAFLENIIANPDDDAPRLVYADWLEERGDLGRAEFIRVQVQRASLPSWDVAQLPLQLRETALRKQYESKWRQELPNIQGITWVQFRRGFMGLASFTNFEVFNKNAKKCWAVAPIEALSMGWPVGGDDISDTLGPIPGLREFTIVGTCLDRQDIVRLGNSPLLSTLRILNVSHANLGTQGFESLVASPHLGNLRSLRAPGNSIGNKGVRALVKSKTLKSLTQLDLSEESGYNRYGEDPVIQSVGLKTLAGWPGLSRITSLALSGNGIQAKGLRALLQSEHVANLKELIVRDSSFNYVEMKEFTSAHPDLRLDVLDLGENVVGDVGPSDLALAPCLDELKDLRLDQCEIGEGGVKWLTRARFISTLRRLNVNHNTFDVDGLKMLLESNPSALHTLQIVDNELGDDGVMYLAASPASATLQQLGLGENQVTDRGAEALSKSRHLNELLWLELRSNQIGKAAAVALAKSKLGKRLAVLHTGHAESDIRE